MVRYSRSVPSSETPVAAFCSELRILRDMPGTTWNIDEVSKQTGIPRSTIFKDLSGKSLLPEDRLKTLVALWGGDVIEWTKKRERVLELMRKRKPKHTSLIDFEVKSDELHVNISIGCLSSAGLTGSGQHRALDEKVNALPKVLRCKQHSWISEEDEWVLFEVWASVPKGSPKKAAEQLQAEVEKIFNELLGPIKH